MATTVDQENYTRLETLIQRPSAVAIFKECVTKARTTSEILNKPLSPSDAGKVQFQVLRLIDFSENLALVRNHNITETPLALLAGLKLLVYRATVPPTIFNPLSQAINNRDGSLWLNTMCDAVSQVTANPSFGEPLKIAVNLAMPKQI